MSPMRKRRAPGPTHLIRIDDEIFRELQSRATAFETPNTVLRRELGLAPLVDFGDSDETEEAEPPPS